MKLLSLILLSTAAWGMNNSVTATNTGGSTLTNAVVSVPRYFANGEICSYSAPYNSGSKLTYWQVDVKNRYPDLTGTCFGGYLQFAIISFEIPSLAAAATYTVDFRNDSQQSSGGSPLSQAQILNFNTGTGVGSWGAKVTIGVNALTKSVSARTMIGNNHYQYLESGPVRTTILVREDPKSIAGTTGRTTSIGFRCNLNCTTPYDTAVTGSVWVDDANYYSIRPSWVITFNTPHTGFGTVETDNLLDNGWLDRFQDQRIEVLNFYNDGPETTTCYTVPAAFVFPAGARVFEPCTVGTLPTINIDFNRAYISYTKLFPYWDLKYKVGQAAIDNVLGTTGTPQCNQDDCSYANSDHGDTTNTTIAPQMGYGMMFLHGASTGGDSVILGFVPRIDAQFFVSDFDPRLKPAMLGNAKAYMHDPYMFRLENNTTAVYHTGFTDLAFGRQPSADVRPTYMSNDGNGTTFVDHPKSPHGDPVCNVTFNEGCPATYGTCSAPNCMVTCGPGASLGCNVITSATSNHWVADRAHAPREGVMAYLFTGKYIYLELVNALASWMALAGTNAGDPPSGTMSRWGNRGLVYDVYNTTRAHAWGQLNIAAGAFLSWDSMPEKSYLTEKLHNNIAHNEGRLNVLDGDWTPASSDPLPSPAHTTSCTNFNKNTETDIWRMGRCWDAGGKQNTLQFAMEYRPGINVSNCDSGIDQGKASKCLSPWMDSYHIHSLAIQSDWGFKVKGILKAETVHMMHLVADTASLSPGAASFAESIGIYRIGSMSGTAASFTGFMTDWAAMRASVILQTDLGLDINNSQTSIVVSDHSASGTSVGANVMNISLTAGGYFKIGNEKVKVTVIVPKSVTVTAVDPATDRLTAVNCCTSSGLLDGQRIKLTATSMPGGINGNSLCYVNNNQSGQNDNCRFWIHVIDSNTFELHNNATLTSRVDLTTSTFTSLVVHWGIWTITRGDLGTTATSHTATVDAVKRWDIIINPGRVQAPGAHARFYTTVGGVARDHDYSFVDSLTGKVMTGMRFYDIVNGLLPYQEYSGNNTPTSQCNTLTVKVCDEPRWGFSPRPLIRNLKVYPDTNNVTFYYVPPDGNSCRTRVSLTPLTNSDETAAGVSDGMSKLSRSINIASLTTHTTYYYDITCGPNGGAARVMGTFITQ